MFCNTYHNCHNLQQPCQQHARHSLEAEPVVHFLCVLPAYWDHSGACWGGKGAGQMGQRDILMAAGSPGWCGWSQDGGTGALGL